MLLLLLLYFSLRENFCFWSIFSLFKSKSRFVLCIVSGHARGQFQKISLDFFYWAYPIFFKPFFWSSILSDRMRHLEQGALKHFILKWNSAQSQILLGQSVQSVFCLYWVLVLSVSSNSCTQNGTKSNASLNNVNVYERNILTVGKKLRMSWWHWK